MRKREKEKVKKRRKDLILEIFKILVGMEMGNLGI